MPKELLQEFIGKKCEIMLMESISAFQGTILAVEDNWIKFEEKKKIYIINGDMISHIAVAK